MAFKPIPPMPRDPRTPAEWQEAVDAAHLMLTIDDCRMYGLIEGGPEINRERCLEILKRGKHRGFEPQPMEDA